MRPEELHLRDIVEAGGCAGGYPFRTVLQSTLIALCLLTTGESQPASRVELLEPGGFHKGEVRARSGGRWLTLAPAGTGFAWRFSTILIRPVEDPLVDDPGERTGVEVRVPGIRPVFMIRGMDDLSGKAVRTALFDPDGRELPDNGALTLTLPNANYALRLTGKRHNDTDPPQISRLLLESNGVVQTLYEWPEGFLDQHCEVVWAGDLDGDGKLDLYMHLSDHYNVVEATLFLSSRGGAGKLVQPVAVFRMVGC